MLQCELDGIGGQPSLQRDQHKLRPHRLQHLDGTAKGANPARRQRLVCPVKDPTGDVSNPDFADGVTAQRVEVDLKMRSRRITYEAHGEWILKEGRSRCSGHQQRRCAAGDHGILSMARTTGRRSPATILWPSVLGCMPSNRADAGTAFAASTSGIPRRRAISRIALEYTSIIKLNPSSLEVSYGGLPYKPRNLGVQENRLGVIRTTVEFCARSMRTKYSRLSR